MITFFGPTARHLQASEKFTGTVGKINCDRFPSGESYCQIRDNIRGNDIFVVQSISHPANDSLMDLLVIGDAARRASAGRLTAVIPNMGYMRQDRKDKPRVPISAKLVVDMIECAGFSRIITIDVHTLQAQGFTNLPFDHLYAFPIITEYLLSNLQAEDTVIVSPDLGGVKRAMAYADSLKTDFAIVNKKRLTHSKVKADSLIGDVDGKAAIIADDMTESAGTIIEAAKICRAKGAREVRAAITHNCLHSKGKEKLAAALDDGTINEFIVTNTNYSTFEHPKLVTLDVSPLLSEAIRRTNKNESITELFEVKGF